MVRHRYRAVPMKRDWLGAQLAAYLERLRLSMLEARGLRSDAIDWIGWGPEL